MSGRHKSGRSRQSRRLYERPYERPYTDRESDDRVGRSRVQAASVRLKDAVTNMVTMTDFTHLHVFSEAADFNLDLKVHWSQETKSEILLRVLHVLTSLPKDCTTCTIALQGDARPPVLRPPVPTIYNSTEEFIAAFETPGYSDGKWPMERYNALDW